MFMKLNSVIMKRFTFLHNLYVHSSLIKKLNSVMGKESLLMKIQWTFLGLRVEHLYSSDEVTDYKSELPNKRCNDSVCQSENPGLGFTLLHKLEASEIFTHVHSVSVIIKLLLLHVKPKLHKSLATYVDSMSNERQGNEKCSLAI